MSEPTTGSARGAPGSPAIRRYRPGDHAAVYDICVRTADAGGDARGQYHTDDLMPDLFAGPYLYLEPELAFVLDDGWRAVGYVIGTSDTAAFVEEYRQRWIPRLAGRYPRPPEPPRTRDERMIASHYWPERMLLPELNDYPAHLHIDLLPDYQGAGHGRRLIATFLAAAAAAGAPAVHVGMLTVNTRSRGFYDRLGFQPIPVPDPGPLTYLGHPTTRAEGDRGQGDGS
jgi:GNAT superfamily N-acetyltransferase